MGGGNRLYISKLSLLTSSINLSQNSVIASLDKCLSNVAFFNNSPLWRGGICGANDGVVGKNFYGGLNKLRGK
jgi:hypothetical protein